MNKRAVSIGLLYSVLAIIFKLVILLGGYTLTKFGFYYSNIVTVLFTLPFFFLAIYLVREKDLGGIISGKDAMRMAMTVLGISVIILSVYNYIEFNWKFKDIATQYYQGNEYLEILKTQQKKYPDKIKVENFPGIIQEQLSSLSAFKATTGKLIPLLFIGVGGAFISAILLKRSTKK